MKKCLIVVSIVIFASTTNAQDVIEGDENLRDDDMTLLWKDATNALTRSALLERQELLQFRCEQQARRKNRLTDDVEEWKPMDFHNILVDDKHKLLYCYVPKVACTNWKRVLMIATGKWPKDRDGSVTSSILRIPGDLVHAPGTFRRLSNYSVDEIRSKLADHDKLVVVRHPLERLLSAYRNKFEPKHEKSSAYFQTRFGRKIVKKYRSNPTQDSLSKGDDVTFSEFVDFINDDGNENGTRNEHWNSITKLCHPCLVNYNFISKYETLTEDAAEILERIGEKSIVFPVRPQNSEPTANIFDKYYSTLKLSQLRDLAELYRSDFYFFDYSLEQVLGFSVA